MLVHLVTSAHDRGGLCDDVKEREFNTHRAAKSYIKKTRYCGTITKRRIIFPRPAEPAALLHLENTDFFRSSRSSMRDATSSATPLREASGRRWPAGGDCEPRESAERNGAERNPVCLTALRAFLRHANIFSPVLSEAFYSRNDCFPFYLP